MEVALFQKVAQTLKPIIADRPRAAWLVRERDFQARSFDGRRIWLFAGGEGGEVPRAARDEAPSAPQHAIGPLLLKLHSEGTSYAAMASELHDRGIEPPRGGRWREASLWGYLKRAMNVSSLRRPRKAGA